MTDIRFYLSLTYFLIVTASLLYVLFIDKSEETKYFIPYLMILSLVSGTMTILYTL